jgi:hypothetical protein
VNLLGGLINRVETIEALWDELKAEYRKQSWGKVSKVIKDVKADAEFGRYLLSNVDRFTPPPVYQQDMRTTEQKIAMKRAQIEYLQQEITRLETEGEPAVTIPDLHFALLRDHRKTVDSRKNIMALKFQNKGTSELEFTIHVIGVASEGLG